MRQLPHVVAALLLAGTAAPLLAEHMDEWEAHQSERRLQKLQDSVYDHHSSSSSSSPLDGAMSAFRDSMAKEEEERRHKVVATYTYTIHKDPTPAQVQAKIVEMANGGDVDAMTLLASQLMKKPGRTQQDCDQARGWMERAAAKGCADGHAQLAWIYSEGLGVARDLVKAREESGIAARAGHQVISGLYGTLTCFDLPGAPRDAKTAAPYLEIGAARGEQVPQLLLAQLLMNGEGVTQDYPRAVQLLKKLAETGNANALQSLATCLIDGHGIEADPVTGFSMMTRAHADLNPGTMPHASAALVLARMLLNGNGVAADPVKALPLLKEAAEEGHVRAQGEYGDLLFGGAQGIAPDQAAGFSWMRKSADAGDSHYRTVVGQLYENGQGVAKDEAAALRYYQSAAEQGEGYAMWKIGIFHYVGQAGLAADHAAAAPWIARAAATGLPVAQCDHGEMLLKGDGIAKDEAKGVAMLTAALEGSDGRIAFNVGDVYEGVGRKEEAIAAYRLALERGNDEAKAKLEALLDGPAAVPPLRAAAEKGDTDAQLRLGLMTVAGRNGVAADVEAGKSLIVRAAEAGNAKAQETLGDSCERGANGCAQDDAQALAWYRKAAEQKRPEAMRRAGELTLVGRGTAANPTAGAELIRRAAEAGSPQAAKDYGELLLAGDGVNADERKGTDMLEQALRTGSPAVAAQVGLANLRAERKEAAIAALRVAAKGDDAEAKRLLVELGAP